MTLLKQKLCLSVQDSDDVEIQKTSRFKEPQESEDVEILMPLNFRSHDSED